MTDNPFDDLESNDEAADATPTEDQSEPTTSHHSTSESARTPPAEPATDRDPAETGPAFEYSEVRQKPLYARAETWDEFETERRTTIGPKLAEAGVLDEETREIHNAILKLATEQPGRVAELVLEERRES